MCDLISIVWLYNLWLCYAAGKTWRGNAKREGVGSTSSYVERAFELCGICLIPCELKVEVIQYQTSIHAVQLNFHRVEVTFYLGQSFAIVGA